MADMNERERIVDEINALYMTADIARIARYDEVCDFAQRVINSCGLQHNVQVAKLDESALCMDIEVPYVKIASILSKEFNDHRRYFGIAFERMKDSSGIEKIVPKLDVYGMSCAAIYYNTPNHDLIKTCNEIACRLPELQALVNSDTFKSYASDILNYKNAQESLKKFDSNAKEERIQSIAVSFKPDEVLVDDRGHSHTVLKATAKRLYLSNLTYRNVDKRHSLDKTDVARWLESGSWHRRAN